MVRYWWRRRWKICPIPSTGRKVWLVLPVFVLHQPFSKFIMVDGSTLSSFSLTGYMFSLRCDLVFHSSTASNWEKCTVFKCRLISPQYDLIGNVSAEKAAGDEAVSGFKHFSYLWDKLQLTVVQIVLPAPIAICNVLIEKARGAR